MRHEIRAPGSAIASLLAPADVGCADGRPAPGLPTALVKAGCAACHQPVSRSARQASELPPALQPFADVLTNRPVAAYSDLLLHDMGEGLADGFQQGTARGTDWRTAPLWGLRHKPAFLHDNRVRVGAQPGATHEERFMAALDAAIRAHRSDGSEANQVIENDLGASRTNRKHNHSEAERRALRTFLANDC